MPVNFLKVVLNVVFELKPDSKAIPMMFKCWCAFECNRSLSLVHAIAVHKLVEISLKLLVDQVR